MTSAANNRTGPAASSRPSAETAEVPEQDAPEWQGDQSQWLTRREREVLHAMSRGKADVQIGAELRVSQTAVNKHVRALVRKLGARDRAHAVGLGFRAGLLDPDPPSQGTGGPTRLLPPKWRARAAEAADLLAAAVCGDGDDATVPNSFKVVRKTLDQEWGSRLDVLAEGLAWPSGAAVAWQADPDGPEALTLVADQRRLDDVYCGGEHEVLVMFVSTHKTETKTE
ncbi:MAG: LuxR C-terminal-related transcriptional regulator [Stackebrandtia sp.]